MVGAAKYLKKGSYKKTSPSSKKATLLVCPADGPGNFACRIAGTVKPHAFASSLNGMDLLASLKSRFEQFTRMESDSIQEVLMVERSRVINNKSPLLFEPLPEDGPVVDMFPVLLDSMEVDENPPQVKEEVGSSDLPVVNQPAAPSFAEVAARNSIPKSQISRKVKNFKV